MAWYEKNIGKIVMFLGVALLILGWMGEMGSIDGPGIIVIDSNLMVTGGIMIVLGGIAHAISNWNLK